MTVALDQTIIEISQLLLQRGLKMASAESCTGGWIAQQATRFSGSSDWFECGFVTYSNEAKKNMLGVKRKAIAKHGAVSEEVVLQMVTGAIEKSAAQVAVAVSGVAGPTGGTPEKPVGTVWLAWGIQVSPGSALSLGAYRYVFQGSRHAIRKQSVEAAFGGLLDRLKNFNQG